MRKAAELFFIFKDALRQATVLVGLPMKSVRRIDDLCLGKS